MSASNIGVLVGDQDITIGTDTPYSQMYRVSSIINHSAFSTTTNQNDIALLKTSTTIQYNRAVGPACLPFPYSSTAFENAVLEVPGWGTTSFGGPTSNNLLTVSLNTMINTNCVSRGVSNIFGGQICKLIRFYTFNRSTNFSLFSIKVLLQVEEMLASSIQVVVYTIEVINCML